MTKRSVILIICRVFNYGVMLLSPMFLVRIFDLEAYGQYREFMLYAMLISGVIEFTINRNLIYFIPKYPRSERESLTHTTALILAASLIGLAFVYLFRGIVFSHAHFDFIKPLLLYIFFFLNFDYYENYLLGKKRTDHVLVYSSVRITVRTIALLVAAVVSRDVMTVVYTLIAVEIVKCLFVLAVLGKNLLLTVDRRLLLEQLRFILPLGVAATIAVINNQLANLFISIKMGVESLALYSIGGQQVPVINIVRSSVMDVLFPEMAQLGDEDRVHLWQRANVVFWLAVVPVYIVFFFFARTFIETLFTRDYLAAVPLFRIYLTIILLQCFEVGTMLRAINENKYSIYAGVFDVAANIGLLLLLFTPIGFVLPAIAFIVGEFIASAYLAAKIMHFYRIPLRGLFLWRKLAVIAARAVFALPVLVAGSFVPMNPVARAVAFSLIYFLAYYLLVRRARIEEADLLVEKARKLLKRTRA
jgi:O-antigen/teichoic acid export membrane protein